MRAAELVEGSEYAFRSAPLPGSELVRVKLLDALPIGKKVGVRFESGERAGQEGMVTLGQLTVPWEGVEALEAE